MEPTIRVGFSVHRLLEHLGMLRPAFAADLGVSVRTVVRAEVRAEVDNLISRPLARAVLLRWEVETLRAELAVERRRQGQLQAPGQGTRIPPELPRPTAKPESGG